MTMPTVVTPAALSISESKNSAGSAGVPAMLISCTGRMAPLYVNPKEIPDKGKGLVAWNSTGTLMAPTAPRVSTTRSVYGM
jgi:hypothetical protein